MHVYVSVYVYVEKCVYRGICICRHKCKTVYIHMHIAYAYIYICTYIYIYVFIVSSVHACAYKQIIYNNLCISRQRRRNKEYAAHVSPAEG